MLKKPNWIKTGPMGTTTVGGKTSAVNPSNIREIARAYNSGYSTMSKNVSKNVAAFNKQYSIAAKIIDRTGSMYMPEEKMVGAGLAKFGRAAPAVAKGSKLLGGITPGTVALTLAEGVYKGTKRALGPGGTQFHTGTGVPIWEDRNTDNIGSKLNG
jgi:hypothetical protein